MAAIEAVSVFVIRISMSVGLAASLCGWCACMQTMRKAPRLIQISYNSVR
jgi:hypothetical protein